MRRHRAVPLDGQPAHRRCCSTAALLIERGPDVVPGRGRGRPAGSFALHVDRGVLLVADIGATGMRAARVRPARRILADQTTAQRRDRRPRARCSRRVEALFAQLLAGAGRGRDEVHGLGLAVPGPVDFDERARWSARRS